MSRNFKKNEREQTWVPHNTTQSELISVDASLRLDGIPAFDLWDLVIDVLHSQSNRKQQLNQVTTGTPVAW